jgi:hypothetical protein
VCTGSHYSARGWMLRYLTLLPCGGKERLQARAAPGRAILPVPVRAGATKPKRLRSVDKEVMMVRLAVMYPKTADSTFDLDYYLTKHMPLARERLSTSGLTATHIDEGLGGGAPGDQLPTR